MITENEINKWAHDIRHADWHYNYSDDHSVWSRGTKQIDNLIDRAKSSNYQIDDLVLIHKKIMESYQRSEWEPNEYRNAYTWFITRIEYLFRIRIPNYDR